MRESVIFTGLEVIDILTKAAHDKLGREEAWAYEDRVLNIRGAYNDSEKADDWKYTLSWGLAEPVKTPEPAEVG